MNDYESGVGGVGAPIVVIQSSGGAGLCQNHGVCLLCGPLGCGPGNPKISAHIVRRRQSYRRGEVIFRAGDACDFVYAVRSGSVKTSISTDDGRVQVTGFHALGDLLGLGALSGREYSCEARALETTSACKIAVEYFEELADSVPAFRAEIMRAMSEQIRHNETCMLSLGKRSAEERLANYLLGQSWRFAKRSFSATEFHLTMSRADIGNFLGITEETVCRILARFHANGIIKTQRRLVVLRDCERLATIAAGRKES
jgi:CRP/FNR family transcriptional regulator